MSNCSISSNIVVAPFRRLFSRKKIFLIKKLKKILKNILTAQMQIIMFIPPRCWLTTQDIHTLFVFFDYVVRTRALARSSRWIISLSMWMMINVTSFYIATDSFLWSDLWDLKCSAAAEFDSVSAARQKIIFFHVCMKFNWADKISFSSSNNFWIADKRATFCGRPARHSKYIQRRRGITRQCVVFIWTEFSFFWYLPTLLSI